MAYCTKCGKPNADIAKFCTSCGITLHNIIQPVIPPVSKSKWFIIVITTFLVLSFSIYFAFLKGVKKMAGQKIETSTDKKIIDSFKIKSSYLLPQQCLYKIIESKKVKMPNYLGFFPIGWSRDGKFAWVEENNPDAFNGYYFKIIIQDMETDKKIWQWNFDVSEEDTNLEDQKGGFKTEDENDVNRKKIWSRYNELITNNLNQHQIEPLNFTSLEKIPFNTNGNSYGFAIRNQIYDNPTSNHSEILGTSVYLTINGYDKKRIYSQKYVAGTNEYDGHLSNQLNGFIRNVYENRVALFLLDEFNGWETSSELNITMIGCDLNNVGLY